MKSGIKIADALGNRDLLRLNKTAFLCSRKIPASAVLKRYDWAIEQREKGNCVISGFHSKLEKDLNHTEKAILNILQQGPGSTDEIIKNGIDKTNWCTATYFKGAIEKRPD